MSEILARFKKKYTLALLFWASGTVLAFQTDATLGSYTAFATIVLGLFKTADVIDKNINGGQY